MPPQQQFWRSIAIDEGATSNELFLYFTLPHTNHRSLGGYFSYFGDIFPIFCTSFPQFVDSNTNLLCVHTHIYVGLGGESVGEIILFIFIELIIFLSFSSLTRGSNVCIFFSCLDHWGGICKRWHYNTEVLFIFVSWSALVHTTLFFLKFFGKGLEI